MLCHQVWKIIWGDHNAQRNGRPGQSQLGVDVWGQPIWTGLCAGVQCKDKDGQLGSELTTAQLDAECANAIGFTPMLDEFTIATTAARDAKIQRHARALNAGNHLPFSVHVWSWDDIETEIRVRPSLREQFYPGWTGTFDDERHIKLSVLAQEDHLYAFFSRPAMEQAVSRSLRDLVLPLIYELADNSFIHGLATEFDVLCHDDKILLSDDGRAFDPLTGLNPSLASTSGHMGSLVVASFLKHYRGQVTPSYMRESGQNRLCLKFDLPLAHFPVPQRLEFPINLAVTGNRRGAARQAAALQIPAGVQDVIVNVVQSRNASVSYEFVRILLTRLPVGARLTLHISSSPYVNDMEARFNDSRLSVVLR